MNQDTVTTIKTEPADPYKTAGLLSGLEAVQASGQEPIESGRLTRLLNEIDERLSYYPFGFSLIAVGITLKSALNNMLEGDGLYFSIPSTDIDAKNPTGNRYKELTAAFKSFEARPEVKDFTFEDTKIGFTFKNIPISISVHTRENKYLSNPSAINIGRTPLQIPNPVNEYFKEEGGVK